MKRIYLLGIFISIFTNIVFGQEVNERLIYAVRDNNMEEISGAIKEGADVNFYDNYGYTPIFYAIRYKNYEAVELLLKSGANPNIEIKARDDDFDGFTPLIYATYFEDNTDIMKILLDYGAKINKKIKRRATYETYSALHLAIDRENYENFKFLVDNGANINLKASGVTPLVYSAMLALTDFSMYLVQHGAKVKVTDNFGRSVLYLSCYSDDAFDLIKILVEKGADVNKRVPFWTNKWNGTLETPLMAACAVKENPKIAEFLINNGAKVNVQNKRKQTPLQRAASIDSNIIIVNLLLEHGADVNVADYLGYTPLAAACFHTDDAQITKILVEKGADIEARTVYNMTPLYLAAINENIESFKYLYQKGADINVTDDSGHHIWEFVRGDNSNIIHTFVLADDYKMVEFFLSKGAEPNLRNDDGFTPLDLAKLNNNTEMIELLEKYIQQDNN